MKKLVFLLVFVSSQIIAQDSLKLGFNVELWNDFVNNISGGIRQGTVYKGLFAFDPNLSYKNVGFKGSYCYSFGKSPTTELVGDMHVLSNIDTDQKFFILESYFYWKLRSFRLEMGIINMNNEFIYCDDSEFFINSSFGIPSHITYNTPVSVYPLTTFGMNILTTMGEKTNFKIGIYDGIPEEHSYQSLKKTKLFNYGFFGIAELDREISNYTLKAGIYHHTGTNSDIDSLRRVQSHESFYTILSCKITENEYSKISTFVQFSHSIRAVSHHHYYLGGGIVYNFLKKEQTESVNQLALGIAYAGHKGNLRGESAIELVYTKNLGKYFLIHPDIQYIINPSGYDRPLKNALTLNLRIVAIVSK